MEHVGHSVSVSLRSSLQHEHLCAVFCLRKTSLPWSSRNSFSSVDIAKVLLDGVAEPKNLGVPVKKNGDTVLGTDIVVPKASLLVIEAAATVML